MMLVRARNRRELPAKRRLLTHEVMKSMPSRVHRQTYAENLNGREQFYWRRRATINLLILVITPVWSPRRLAVTVMIREDMDGTESIWKLVLRSEECSELPCSHR